MSCKPKLILGTANLGFERYGYRKKFMTRDEAQQIVNEAGTLGIDTIDTAPAYGCDVLDFTGFNVIQKTPYDGGQAYAVLLHDLQHVYRDMQTLQEARNAGHVQYIGASVYTPNQFSEVVNYPVDIIQVPMNIIDNRFTEVYKSHVQHARIRGIQIHARSVFLQGALLDGVDSPVPLPKLSVELCLGYVLSQPIDAVVIGVDSILQLHTLMRIQPLPIQIRNMAPGNLDIIDPRRWPETS